MSERDALIERVKRQAKLPYNRLCSEVRLIGGPIMETGCGPYQMERDYVRRRDSHPTRLPLERIEFSTLFYRLRFYLS